MLEYVSLPFSRNLTSIHKSLLKVANCTLANSYVCNTFNCTLWLNYYNAGAFPLELAGPLTMRVCATILLMEYKIHTHTYTHTYKHIHTHTYTHTYTHMHIRAHTYTPGLKPGRVIQVIQVNRVTFCPGQVGLTHFIRYPDLTRILHCTTCVDDGAWPL